MARIRSRAGGGRRRASRWIVGCRAALGWWALVVLLAGGGRDGGEIRAVTAPEASEAEANRPVTTRLGPVPNLRGEPIDRAAQLVSLSGRTAAVGFWPIPPALWRAELDPRKVGAQYPEPGWQVQSGPMKTATTLGLWRFVPADPQAKPVVVPDLTGRSWEQARAEATRAGLTPFGPPPQSPSVEVVAQHPRAGLTVVQGLSVLLLPRTDPVPEPPSATPPPPLVSGDPAQESPPPPTPSG